MGTNPFPIPIGTSDPVSICDGLPLFSLGTARAGVSASSRSYALIDTSATILATRLKVSAYASYAFGICGPAIAFLSRNVDVFRTNSGDKGELTLTFNEGLLMQAGAFIGASAGAGVTLALQIYKPDPWYKPWSIGWRDAFTVDIGVRVDLFKLLYQLIRYLLGRNSKTSFTEDSQNSLQKLILATDFIMVDTVGSSNTVEPDLRAEPGLTLPINLANYFPPLKAVNDGLSKVGGEISVGPSIGLLFPVTFNFDHFTVVGGLEGASSADYGNVRYAGNRVSATGNTKFNTGVKPSRVTTYVTYYTSFTLAISFHFRVTMAKFFNFEVNSASLDLGYLLFGTPESDRSVRMSSSVSTGVEGGCVLTPNMTLSFTGPNPPNFQTGELLKGTVTLPQYESSSAATVALEIEPAVAGFPVSTTIPAGSESAPFYFTFQNQCLATGNPNDPSETEPPGPLSPLQTYTVRARLQSPSNNPCSDYEVEAALNTANRYLRCQKGSFSSPGTAPPWDSLAGTSINADPTLPGSGLSAAGVSCWFPYLDTEPIATVPMKFTLLDENRLPHTGSNVVISVNGTNVSLNPSASAAVTLSRSYGSSGFTVHWYSKGPHTGYSNRFYLIVNAGCQYGQTEFWLDVWNWS
jgi:hypothetical protein